jgi:hypothetical protein
MRGVIVDAALGGGGEANSTWEGGGEASCSRSLGQANSGGLGKHTRRHWRNVPVRLLRSPGRYLGLSLLLAWQHSDSTVAVVQQLRAVM